MRDGEMTDEHVADIVELVRELSRLRAALVRLRQDANRLCDRSLGGTYEEDCRRSIAAADDALAAQRARKATR
jgi:hypothetical protein